MNKCGERFSITLGSVCYCLYIASFILASASIKYPEQQSWYLDKGVIEATILSTAIVNGFGAAILWVAQGKYISRIATDSNKGTYYSIFWAIFMSCLIVGVLFGAIVLDNTDAYVFYCGMTALCVLATLFFLLLRPIPFPKVLPLDGDRTE